jgi:hypothetical protein
LNVRIPSLDIILLDFDAIAGQFVSFSERTFRDWSPARRSG